MQNDEDDDDDNQQGSAKEHSKAKILKKSVEIIFKIFIISNTISSRTIHDKSMIDPNIILATLTYLVSWIFTETEIAYGSLSFMRDVFYTNMHIFDDSAKVYTHSILVFCLTKLLYSWFAFFKVKRLFLKVPRECLVGCAIATGAIHIMNELHRYNSPSTICSFLLSFAFLALFFYSRWLFVACVPAITALSYALFAIFPDRDAFFLEKLSLNLFSPAMFAGFFDLRGLELKSLTRCFFPALAIFIFNGIDIEFEGEEATAKSRDNSASSGRPADEELPRKMHFYAQSRSSRLLQFIRERRIAFLNLGTFFLPFTVKRDRHRFGIKERMLVGCLTLKFMTVVFLLRKLIPKVIYVSLSIFFGLYIIAVSLNEIKKFCLAEKITILSLSVFNAVYNKFLFSALFLTIVIYTTGFFVNKGIKRVRIDPYYSRFIYDYTLKNPNFGGGVVIIDLSGLKYIMSNEREKIQNFVESLNVQEIFILRRKGLFLRLENVNLINSCEEIESRLI